MRNYDYNDHIDYSDIMTEAPHEFTNLDRSRSQGEIQRNYRAGHGRWPGADEWQRKTKRVGNLAEFFAESPLRESGLKIRRSKDRPRKISL